MTVLQSVRQVGAAIRGRRREGRPEYGRKVCAGAVIILTLCRPVSMSAAGGVRGYANTSVASPVRSATVPLSSYQSGLVTRPNPMDSSANRVITGNVAAGKHFRGSIPYRSTTSLNAPLGSASLDSFMRYTATAQTPANSAGTYSPYYSATRTATTTLPGTRSVLTPGTSRVGSSVAAPPVLPPRIASAGAVDAMAGDGVSATLPPLRLWPRSPMPDATWEGMPNRVADPLADRRASPRPSEALTGDEYRRQMELLQERLGQVRAELAELERSVAAGDEKPQLTQAAPPQNLSRREALLQETARLLATTPGLATEAARQGDGILSGNEVTAVPKGGSDTEPRLQLYDMNRLATQMRLIVPPASPQRTDAHTTPPGKATAGTVPSRTATAVSASQRVGQAVQTPDVPAKRPVPKVDEEVTPASLKAFERHLLTAEHHFQCGRYAQAAESFALASAYLPSNARAHLGRSHALLAAGQYVRSAIALARAIELDPQFALRQADLVRVVGGPDAFVARFNELDEAIETGGTPQLQLLLAYVYYQMERPQEARVAIEAARNALPSSIPVDLLRTAIYR